MKLSRTAQRAWDRNGEVVNVKMLTSECKALGSISSEAKEEERA